MNSYENLEHRLNENYGMPYGSVAVCSSGTAALHLALESVLAKVETPSISIYFPEYCMNSIPVSIHLAKGTLSERNVKIFSLPCNKATLNIESAIATSNANKDRLHDVTTILFLQNTFGLSATQSISMFKNTYVIVDSCESSFHVPSVCKNTLTVYSYYRNKLIAGEEGGAVVCSDSDTINLVRSLRSLGINTRVDNTYAPLTTHQVGGFNYRLSNANSELVLKGLSEKSYAREKALTLREAYKNALPYSLWNKFMINNVNDVPWVFPLLLPSSSDRGEILNTLQSFGVEARPGFLNWDFHLGKFFYKDSSFTSRILYLPFDSPLNRESLELLREVGERY